jgi:MFS family permease
MIAHAHRSYAPFFANAFAWNLGLGMTYILIPLYADHLGYSGVAIGSLLSAPVVLQITVSLIGGALTDRIGGKRLALLSSAAIAVGSLVCAYASSLALLVCAQLCFVLSRAAFWPATWSLGSQLPGERGVQLGRLNSITSAGQIVGTAFAGLVLAHFGFRAGFWLLAVLGGGLAFAFMAIFAAPAHRSHGTPLPMFAAYRALARRPAIWFGIMCAYISALPFSLSFSFYPILLVSEGFSSDATGWLIALRALGAVLAGVTAARVVRKVSIRSIPVACALVVALAVSLIAVFKHPAPLSALFLIVGLGSGVMTLYFQILISDLSATEMRGSALALGGLGWGLSHLTTPLIMGALKDAFGIAVAFYVIGAIALVWALALAPMHAWAFRDGKPR